PFPRLPARRVELARLHPPYLGARPGKLPLLGDRHQSEHDRARALAPARDRHRGRAARGLRRRDEKATHTGNGMTGFSPYKGLAPFDDSELDVRLFFGRDHERGLIAANLMASRLTVLYGESGVGKSSVLRAGVAHHLRGLARENIEQRGEPELAVVVFDAWRDDPVRAIGDAVAEAVGETLGRGPLP